MEMTILKEGFLDETTLKEQRYRPVDCGFRNLFTPPQKQGVKLFYVKMVVD
jgi:hypothetical protein